jgi:hypothetical protein
MNRQDFKLELFGKAKSPDVVKISPNNVPEGAETIDFNNLLYKMLPHYEFAEAKDIVVVVENTKISFFRNDLRIFDITQEDGVNIIRERQSGSLDEIGRSVRLIDAMYLIKYRLSVQNMFSDIDPEHRWKHVDTNTDQWKTFIPDQCGKWLSDNDRLLRWSYDPDWGQDGKPTIILLQFSNQLESDCEILYEIYPHLFNSEECFETEYFGDAYSGDLKFINKTLEEAVIAVAEHAEKYHA